MNACVYILLVVSQIVLIYEHVCVYVCISVWVRVCGRKVHLRGEVGSVGVIKDVYACIGYAMCARI